MFWLGVAAMCLMSAGFVLWPLRGKSRGLRRADQALAIFKDQLSEVDRDEARGLISGDDAGAARVEIKRRMLAADKDRETSGPVTQTGHVTLVLAAVLLPAIAALVYTQVGTPGAPSVPFAERESEQQQSGELQSLVAELKTRLENDPEGGETRGWELLAGTYRNMGRFRDAAGAFAVLVTRDDATSATWSQYAEALISAESGVVTPLARQATETAMALDPTNPAATFYLALAIEQDGQPVDARKLLLERIAQEMSPAPWMEPFLQQANRMGAEFGLDPVAMPDFPDAPAGPSAADMQAASDMTPDERAEFVRSMVDRLAARLQDEPENLDGWLQLARAYMVLGENDNARDALQTASPLVAGLDQNDPKRLFVEQSLSALAQP